MPYLFRTPVRNTDWARFPSKPNPHKEFGDGPQGMGPRLMRHVRRDGPAVCVIIDGTTVREKMSPTTAELADATFHYLGGHDYTITQAERDLLVAAGYTVLTV